VVDGANAADAPPMAETAHDDAGDTRPEPPPWDDAPPAQAPAVADARAASDAADAGAIPPVQTDASTALGDAWSALAREMAAAGLIAALVRETAMQSQCVARGVREGVDHWALQVARESLCTEAHRERLEQAMAQTLGQPVSLSLVKGEATDTPAMRDQAERARRQLAAEAMIHGDALVRQLLTTHPGARVVPDSIRPI